MWTFLIVAMIVIVVIMALSGSKGARRLLAVAAALIVLAGVALFALTYKQSKDYERKESARKYRQQTCRSQSDCIYSELQNVKVKIVRVTNSLSADQSNLTDLKQTKVTIDNLLTTEGWTTISDNNQHKLLIYNLHLSCPVEKKFNLQAEYEIPVDEKGVLSVNVWWQGSEEDTSYREWESCVARPQHVMYNLYDPQLSAKFPRKPSNPKPLRPPEGEARSASDDNGLSDAKDHCAVGLKLKERLRRLRAYGPVRQTGSDTYVAGGHRLVVYLGTMISCQ